MSTTIYKTNPSGIGVQFQKFYDNLYRVSAGRYTFFISYETIIAYREGGNNLQVCENVWGNTTGKYLNKIQPSKSKRVPFEEFKRNLQIIMERIEEVQ